MTLLWLSLLSDKPGHQPEHVLQREMERKGGRRKRERKGEREKKRDVCLIMEGQNIAIFSAKPSETGNTQGGWRN